MTDPNTTPAEAVERVAKAQSDYFYNAIETEGVYSFREMATAAIKTHTAWLWERVMSDEVVEAAAKALYCDWQIITAGASGMDITDTEIEEAWQQHLRFTRENDWEPSPRFLAQATIALTAALTLLLGPREREVG